MWLVIDDVQFLVVRRGASATLRISSSTWLSVSQLATFLLQEMVTHKVLEYMD